MVLHADDYPHYFEALRHARAIDAHEARNDPRTREFRDHYLVPLGIMSMLDATIRIEGKIQGVVCFEHVGQARQWSLDEISCAGQAADLAVQIHQSEQRRQTQALLSQSQRMEALGQLAGGVAHDFNNMLAGILGSTELIARRPEAQSEIIQRSLNTIGLTARRAADLTHKLLSFSRKSREHSEPIRIHKIIQDTIDIFQFGNEHAIAVDVHPKAKNHVVLGDATELQNALLNILINARDAMPQSNGALCVATQEFQAIEPQHVGINAALADGEYIQVAIRDNGVSGVVDSFEKSSGHR
jgi:signal transduction histidine kinase